MTIPRVIGLELAGEYSLRLTFKNGKRRLVDLEPLLGRGVFKRLRDPAYFRRVVLDPVAGTIVWPNGADVAPETLYELPDLGRRRANGRIGNAAPKSSKRGRVGRPARTPQG